MEFNQCAGSLFLFLATYDSVQAANKVLCVLMQVVLDAVRKSGMPFTTVINDLFFGW